jgi:zinc protease
MSVVTQAEADEQLTEVQSVEGITEFRLDNGMQVLFVPDDSKSLVTVNVTYFVGSRHEGYGEAGMAHLLEHMLFKGTPSRTEIPKSLKDRGASYNATTWLDRTNYFETLESKPGNLEFAIALEADRMVNSNVAGEDLNKEMTVVRNEFESGENNPFQVLQQRLFSAAYQWHNYGQSTIGNRSDIERVPIENLRSFYRRFYRPDNSMLVVAGKFDQAEAKELIIKYMGVLENPSKPLNSTYTVEPPQDGERLTVVRRVGDAQYVAAGYHIPAGADPEYPAIEALTEILTKKPGGRLYSDLVSTSIATSVFGTSFALHDPGMMFFGAEVPLDKSLETARQAMISTLENITEKPITASELQRAKNSMLKARELRAGNSTALATELSEWASQGDWRLYFLNRDRIEALTETDVQAVAEKFLLESNRTVGLFLPTSSPTRTPELERMDVAAMLDGYTGREAMADGEQFESTLANIESRTERGETEEGLKYALLPKNTRGETASISLALRFGDEKSMFDRSTAISMLGSLMRRGTDSMDYQALNDRLDELRANVSISSQPSLLRVSINSKRESIPEVMQIVEQMLRQPKLPESEFELLKQEAITGLESQRSEPQALAPRAVLQAMNQFPKGDYRYNGSIEEDLEDVRETTLDDVQYVYEQLIGGGSAELVAVGAFDPDSLKESASKIIDNWNAAVDYERAGTPANTSVAGQSITVETPDKANALYFASQDFEIRDDDPDYPALVIGNYVLGSGALSSRLGDRVRQEEGLSYSVASILQSHPVDKRTSMIVYAITNPANRTKLMAAISEEIRKLVADGITEKELNDAKSGFLQQQQVSRASDAQIAGLLSSSVFAGRTMQYDENFESAIAALSVADVNAVLAKLVDPDRFVIGMAGDFVGNPSGDSQ